MTKNDKNTGSQKMETLNKLIQKIREAHWHCLEDLVIPGCNPTYSFPGASGASGNPSSTNISKYGLEASYKKKRVVVTLEKKCYTSEHIRVHPGDVPTSVMNINWKNIYRGLTKEEREEAEARTKEKVRKRFMDKGAKYIAEGEHEIMYNL